MKTEPKIWRVLDIYFAENEKTAVNRTIGGLMKTEPKIWRVLDIYFFLLRGGKDCLSRSEEIIMRIAHKCAKGHGLITTKAD